MTKMSPDSHSQHLHQTILIFLTYSLLMSTAKSQVGSPCTSSMITNFKPCFNYMTSSSSSSEPTHDCCESLESLMSDNMDCACLIVTGNVPVSIPFVTANVAVTLPVVCTTPMPLQCNASGSGVPLPPSGPALFGPSPSPHGHSPKGSKVVTSVASPPPENLGTAPGFSSKFPLAPNADNNELRPYIDPISHSNPTKVLSLAYLILMFLGSVMVFAFLG